MLGRLNSEGPCGSSPTMTLCRRDSLGALGPGRPLDVRPNNILQPHFPFFSSLPPTETQRNSPPFLTTIPFPLPGMRQAVSLSETFCVLVQRLVTLPAHSLFSILQVSAPTGTTAGSLPRPLLTREMPLFHVPVSTTGTNTICW